MFAMVQLPPLHMRPPLQSVEHALFLHVSGDGQSAGRTHCTQVPVPLQTLAVSVQSVHVPPGMPQSLFAVPAWHVWRTGSQQPPLHAAPPAQLGVHTPPLQA
jgi:hypothetical protein